MPGSMIGGAREVGARPKDEPARQTCSIHQECLSDFSDCTRYQFFQNIEQRADGRNEIGKPIALGPQQHQRERPMIEPLLMRNTRVGGDEDVELPSHGVQQWPIVPICLWRPCESEPPSHPVDH